MDFKTNYGMPKMVWDLMPHEIKTVFVRCWEDDSAWHQGNSGCHTSISYDFPYTGTSGNATSWPLSIVKFFGMELAPEIKKGDLVTLYGVKLRVTNIQPYSSEVHTKVRFLSVSVEVA